MPLPSDYISGTINLTNGSVDFTGTGTGWLAADFREGDIILDIAGGGGRVAVVQTITGNAAGTLSKAWDGPTLTGVAYRIRYQWDSSRVSAQTRTMIEKLGNGNLESFSSVTGPGVVVMDGPHSVAVKPEADFINGVAYDVQVDTLTDRDAYDGQSVGFAVLVSDVGDGRSAIYSKASNTVADWTDPAYVTGPFGEMPTLEFSATPLPPGSDPTATETPVSGGYTVELGIPSGRGPVPRGSYNPATAYVLDDSVLDNGSTWIALQATTGNAPPVLPTTSNAYWQLLARQGTDGVVSVPGIQPQGRLSLTTGVAAPEADVTGAVSIGYVPSGGIYVPIFNGSIFNAKSIGTGLSLPLNANSGHTGYHSANTNFDLFVVDDGGTIRLVTGPSWNSGAVAGSNVARGTGAGSSELEEYLGYKVNKNPMTVRFGSASGDTVTVPARRATYVGSFRATANGQASDTRALRLLFNAYNIIRRPIKVVDPAVSWTYNTGAFRQANGNASMKAQLLLGLSGIAVDAEYSIVVNNTTASSYAVLGIGIDSTTVNANDVYGGTTFLGVPTRDVAVKYLGFPGLGFHEIVPLESSGPVGTTTFYSAGNGYKVGLYGSFWG